MTTNNNNKKEWKCVPSYMFDKQDTCYTCGPTSMSMGFTELFPGNCSRESELAKYANTTPGGTSHEGLKKAFIDELAKLGEKGTYEECNIDSMDFNKLGNLLEDPNVFVIAHGMTGGWKSYWKNNYGHYVYPIAVNTSKQEIKIADPTKGVITYSKSEWEKGLRMISQKSYLIFTKI